MKISLVNSSNYVQTPSTQADVGHETPVKAPASGVVAETPKPVRPAGDATDAQLLKQSVDKINQAVQVNARNLQFAVDEETGINVVKVIDTESQEVIRQIPSKEIIVIAKALDKLQGLLVRDKA